MGLSMVALALICVAGGLLLVSGINELFLDHATGVIVSGIQQAGMVLQSIQ